MRTHGFGISLALLVLAAACTDTPDHSAGGVPADSVATPRTAAALSGWRVMNQFPIARGTIRYRPQPIAVPTPAQSQPPMLGPEGAAPSSGALVLYDDGGPWGWLGELYAIGMGTLASHFGPWTAKPIGAYSAQEMTAYRAVIYLGSTFDQPVPSAFLSDVASGVRPVRWIDDNIWQLVNAYPSFATTYGFMPWIFDTATVSQVEYKGTALARYAANMAGIMTYSSVSSGKVLAEARRSDGSSFPWAIRGANLTYIGENPLAYIGPNDRYLALCDLLFDLLAPATPERHRALVRIEDVNPTSSPKALRAIADYLEKAKVPFSVATIPVYTDPNGYYNDGVPETYSLEDKSAVAKAIKYMLAKGGRLVMHGYTHQYSNVANPYGGVTGDDFEFYRTHFDAAGYLVYDGPVAEDSAAWADGRVKAGLKIFGAVGLASPPVFEFPHYAGSPLSAQGIRTTFSTAYHRGMFFGGSLTGQTANYGHYIGLFYPYVVQDIYGFKQIPENLGYYEPNPDHHNLPWYVPDLLGAANANRVVRDGFASFFFHPEFNVSILKQIVSGVKAAGYTFVAPESL